MIFQSLSYETVKRNFDFALATLLVVILLPFFVITSLLVFLESGHNPIFIQERGLTLDKYRFRLYQFRTLKVHIKGKKKNNILIKEEMSDCITFIGGVRRTGLDELPQILNIIKGEMSFICPRPLSVEDLELMELLYPADYELRKRIYSLPGITGYWQIFGNRSEGITNLVDMVLRYEKEKSLIFDLFIAAVTIPVALFGMHSDALTFSGNYRKNTTDYSKRPQSHYNLFHNKI